ncbi:MAG: O-antigen ligase family protein [Crocinitomicaceae bacterium]|nr:O-antigen ligase family protein [Crocinitomicaceae bacterium]
MLKNRLGDTKFHYLVSLGYAGIAIGLPLSKAILSISLVFLILLFLLGGEIKTVLQKLKEQPILMWLFVFLGIHLLSFIWSEDLVFALKDLKNKIPLYVLPLLWVIHPLKTTKESKIILGLFVLSVTITSLVNFVSYEFGWLNKTYVDIRSLSLFISHIRFALMVAFAAAIAWYYARNTTSSFKYLLYLLITWLIFYTYYSQVLSGALVLIGVFIFVLVRQMLRGENKIVSSLILLFLLGASIFFTYGIWFIFQKQELKISLTDLPIQTKEGNFYYHQTNPLILENGYPLNCFINEQELRREWNKRSSIPFDSSDKKGQELRETIKRYVTSKGFRKDAVGILALSDQDIKNIENGIPTILALKGGIIGRLYSLRYELLNNDNPNGQSISQRMIYWKTGFKIAKQNWLFGIGSGDIQQAFQKQYELDHSPLEMTNRNRSHNQFLTYFITFGVFGFLLFSWILIKAWSYFRAHHKLLGMLFLIISILSFLVEDTLETQMGVTFFAFFFGYFISEKKAEE